MSDHVGWVALPESGARPDFVMFYVVMLTLAAVSWFAVRGLARRRARLTGVAQGGRVYRWADPLVASVRVWVTSAPATFAYMFVWSVTSILQQSSPTSRVDVIVRANSTNLSGLFTDPVRVLFSSAFLVADKGFGFILYVLTFTLIAARLEHRLGSARTIVVMVASHVLGTLIISLVQVLNYRRGMIGPEVIFTADVGVSYVMVGACAAYLLLITPRMRPWFALALVAGLVGPVLADPNIWNWGHLAAACVGLVVGRIVIRSGPLRPPIVWRDLRQAAVRPL